MTSIFLARTDPSMASEKPNFLASKLALTYHLEVQ